MFTIYYSDVTGVPSNCSYPHKKLVTDEASFKEAISPHSVSAASKHSHRKHANCRGRHRLPAA